MIRKIAIVHTDFRLYWPARLRMLNSFLADRNIELFIVEISGKGSPYSFASSSGSDSGLRWTRLFESMKMEAIDAGDAVDAVCRKFDELQPDAVIAGPVAFPAGAASVRWCSRRRIPLVVFDDARLDDVPRPFYVDWIKKQVYSLVDAMMIPAPSHDSTFLYFGFRQERLFYGVDVVDNDFFSSGAVSDGVQPGTGDVFSAAPFFLAVGRQVAKKNWKMLLAAFMQAIGNPAMNGWSLVFIGEGEEHAELVELSGGLHGSRVHFLPFRSQQELTGYYRQASVLVLPSLQGESWGLVVNEAMASGLPVLVSRKCGCAEALVHDGDNGYLFDPENLNGIACTLVKYAGLDDMQRREMGLASQRIIAEWGLDRFCRGMWDAVSFACANKKRSGSFAGRRIISYWNGRYRPT